MHPDQLTPQLPKQVVQHRQAYRVRPDNLRTEDVYVDFASPYILFHCKRHPREMGAAKINLFLTHLAVDGYEIRAIQVLVVLANLEASIIYTHFRQRGGRGVQKSVAAAVMSNTAIEVFPR